MLDTVIRNGILVFPEGDVRADLAVSDGRIAALLKPGEEAPSREVIDAGGLRVLPGLIDAHMHVQAPFQGVTPQLTVLGSPQASPAMRVCRSPVTLRGLPSPATAER